MQLSRLSLPFLVAVLVPAISLAAPAQTVSELFQRFATSDETRQFSMETTIVDPLGATTAVSVQGKMRGQGGDAIAHGIVKVTSGADTMRLRLVLIDETIYLKLSQSGPADTGDMMNLAEDLGIEPWLAIPLNAETVLEDAPLTVFGISTTDLSTKDNVMVSQLIDSLLCITSAVSDGKGGTVYTIELMNRPVLALAKAFGGMIMMGGDNADLERDLELRRLDGMVRDAVTFLAHLHETSAGDLGASDLTLNVDTDETGAIAFKMTTTVIPQSFTLVQPLLTITIDEMMAAQSQDSTSWSFMMPVHEEMDWDASAGCSVIDMRRGVCEMPYVSRRHLGQ